MFLDNVLTGMEYGIYTWDPLWVNKELLENPDFKPCVPSTVGMSGRPGTLPRLWLYTP